MKKYIILLLVTMMTVGVWAQTEDPTTTTAPATTTQGQEDVPLPKSLRTKETNDKNSTTTPKKSKVRLQTGGGFGFSASSNYLQLNIRPQLGIYLTNWLLLGVTGTYIFSWDFNFKKDLHTFGADVYFQGYAFQRKLILHAGYEYLNFPYLSVKREDNIDKLVTKRCDSHIVKVGLGYRSYVSDRVSLSGMILVPVFQYSNSGKKYYQDWIPIVSFGVNYDI